MEGGTATVSTVISAITDAAQTMQTDVFSGIGQLLPIILPILAALIIVSILIRVIQRVTGRRA